MDIHTCMLNRRLRARRMHRFAVAFGIKPDTRILDIGGTHDIWMPCRCGPTWSY